MSEIHVGPIFLTEGELKFAEALGVHVESLGLPRIAGRIFGLMLIAPRPLALEEIAAILRVSRASVSINTRIGIATGVLEQRSVRGDRRKFYQFSPRAIESRLDLARRHVAGMRRVLAQGTADLHDANGEGRDRLLMVSAFVDFLDGRLTEFTPMFLERFSAQKAT